MNTGIWIAVIIILLVAVLIMFTLYRLGYRLYKLSKKKDAKDKSLGEIPDLQSVGPEAALALSTIDNGVMLISDNDQIRYANESAARIFGMSADRCRGRTFIEVVRDYECDSLLRKCAVSGILQVSEIKTHPNKQMLRVIIFPGIEKDSYVVTIQDLTERQRLEEIRRDFISNIAQDLRTSLDAIRTMTEAKGGGTDADECVIGDILVKIKTETTKLERLTDDLSELYRMEKGGSAHGRDETDLARLIRQAVERLQAQAHRAGLTVNVSVDPSLPRVVIDRYGIENVLMNLIHNAIKYTDSGGTITISASQDNSKIRVCVSDTGIGIPTAELSRVFERFYKVNKAQETEGSGLGLNISKHTVEDHGGKIWVESEEGKGSNFYFSLPLHG